MALINCPECNKEISDSVRVCPSCGYTLKKKKKAPIVISIILIVLIIGGVAGYFGYTSYQNTQQKIAEYKAEALEVDKTINMINDDMMASITYISEAKDKYNALSPESKKYVENYSKLEKALDDLKSFEITLTDDNIRDYFNFEVTITDRDNSYKKDFLGFYNYTNTARVNVKISPKLNGMIYNNVKFKFDLNCDGGLYGWSGESKEAIIGSDGKAEYDLQLSQSSTGIAITLYYYDDKVTFSEASGSIKFE